MPLRATKPEHPGTSSTVGLEMSPDGNKTRKGSAANDTLAAMAAAAQAAHFSLLTAVNSARRPTAVICPAGVQGKWRQSADLAAPEHGHGSGHLARADEVKAPFKHLPFVRSCSR